MPEKWHGRVMVLLQQRGFNDEIAKPATVSPLHHNDHNDHDHAHHSIITYICTYAAHIRTAHSAQATVKNMPVRRETMNNENYLTTNTTHFISYRKPRKTLHRHIVLVPAALIIRSKWRCSYNNTCNVIG